MKSIKVETARKKTRRYTLTVYEERILRIMRRYYNWMSINEVADDSEIHWRTTKFYLQTLKNKKLVESKGKEGTSYWRAKRVSISYGFDSYDD